MPQITIETTDNVFVIKEKQKHLEVLSKLDTPTLKKLAELSQNESALEMFKNLSLDAIIG